MPDSTTPVCVLPRFLVRFVLRPRLLPNRRLPSNHIEMPSSHALIRNSLPAAVVLVDVISLSYTNSPRLVSETATSGMVLIIATRINFLKFLNFILRDDREILARSIITKAAINTMMSIPDLENATNTLVKASIEAHVRCPLSAHMQLPRRHIISG